MKKLPIPFNIDLLQLTPEDTSRIRQVKSLDPFEGATKNFHPDGLYSTQTFGVAGSDARSTKFGYIDLKITVIHPTLFLTLTSMRGLYRDIMAGKEFAVWDTELSDFVKSDIVDGQTGFQFFIEYFPKIKYQETPSVKRQQAIRLLEGKKKKALLDKVLVLPAGLRDMEVDGTGRYTSDEINDLYRKLLAISNTINPSTVSISPEAYNAQRWALQNTFVEIYEYIIKIIEGKKNLMMGKWASRKVFNGTRNVITSLDTVVDELGAPGNVTTNSVAVGIYQASKAILPVTLYQLRTGFLSEVFPAPGAPALLTNKTTLLTERVQLKADVYDRWLSNEGLEKFVSYFKENSIRHNPISIDQDHYLGLIYRGPDQTFKLIHGIDELPEGRNKEDCTPITMAELLYTQIYYIANNYTGFVTRYPITGIGSITPCKLHLKSTVKKETRKELAQDWKEYGAPRISYEFPVTGSEFFNSLSPHLNRMGPMGGDFDGDMTSLTVAYSDDGMKESERHFASKKGYVGTDGKFLMDNNIDTIKYVLFNLTGDPKPEI